MKNVSSQLEKELRKLKAEFGCRTWAELLTKLVEAETIREVDDKRLSEMKAGVKGFLQLRTSVSNRWIGRPGVLDESRKSRKHEAF